MDVNELTVEDIREMKRQLCSKDVMPKDGAFVFWVWEGKECDTASDATNTLTIET